MTKEAIAEVMTHIARLLEIKGENPFKFRAYANAAHTLETYPGDIRAMAEAGTLGEIEGFGKAIAEKVSTLALTGRLEYYERLKREFPAGILTLFELQGLGGKKIKALHDALGIGSVEALESACRDGTLASLPGFGEKSAANLLEAIAFRKESVGQFLLGDALPLAGDILESLRGHPAVGMAEVAGSLRRRKPVVRDLDFVVSTRKPEDVIASFTNHPRVRKVLAQGPTRASVLTDTGIQCDLRAVTKAEFPFALAYFTGSKEHNIRMRARALERGWTLNEYRLDLVSEGPSPPPAIHSEEDLHRALGLTTIPPELREDRGEFEAAESGRLPRLIEWTQLRGTFHNHTTASDGRATLRAMANAARDLGLEYLGIADHSRSSRQAHGLDAQRLRAQIREIRELNAEGGGGFRIFAGTECDILRDGTLDFPDDLLGELDYVVASVHSAFSLTEREMTDRIIRAIAHPAVTMLGHPTGRLLLAREPYAVNVPALLEAAAETGTVIELNASAQRLDLDWTWWPAARAMGIRCAINTDAHSTEGLASLRLGVEVARKGWLTREDVLNTLPLSEIEPAMRRKRTRATP